eukprot:evm.model.scf_27.13 EVM.evm.TU.scf_27.13   scf_27:94066-98700(-)
MGPKKGRRSSLPRSGEKRPRDQQASPKTNKKQGVEPRRRSSAAAGLFSPAKPCQPAAPADEAEMADGSPPAARNLFSPERRPPRARRGAAGGGAQATRVINFDDEPAGLTLDYSRLVEIYNDLMTVFEIRKVRSQYLTFSEAQRAVQEMSKFRLSIKQLQQLKHVLPECLEWEYVVTGTSSSVTGDQLMLFPTRKKDIRDILRGRLIRITEEARAEGKEPPALMLASLPDPALAILASPSTRKYSQARTPSSLCKANGRVKSPASVRGPRHHKPPKPEDDPKSGPSFPKTERKLFPSESQCLPSGCSQGKKPLTPVMEAAQQEHGTPDENMCTGNVEANKSSPATSQTLISKPGGRILKTSAGVNERQLGHARSTLPRFFDQVRMSFLRARTNARPVNQVVADLKKCMGSGNADSVLVSLQLLLDHAPQYMRLEPGQGKRPDVLAINRECNIKEMRGHLKDVAEQRP